MDFICFNYISENYCLKMGFLWPVYGCYAILFQILK